MTDNEIIKALECCKSFNDLRACYKCPALENGECSNGKVYISNFILDKALDLVNRQKVEIERLDDVVYRLTMHNNSLCLLDETQKKAIKAEAIKEFADKLHDYVSQVDTSKSYDDKDDIVERVVFRIDNLVKEMTEKGR